MPENTSLPREIIGTEEVEAEHDDERFWSVTTIIGALDKPALVPWAAKETAKAAIANERAWRSRLENEGEESAIQYLTGARFRRAPGERTATDLGTAIHAAAETKVLHGEYSAEQRSDAELAPFLVQVDSFLEEIAPAYLAAEVTVFSPTYGYAGTCDAIATIDGNDYVLDYKSTREDLDYQNKLRKPYPEVGLQLAAYRHAEIAAVWRARRTEVFKRRYYLLNDTERSLAVPVPEVVGGMAVLITPTRYAVHPVRCDDEIFEVFLHVVECARFQFELADHVVGNALIPPTALSRSL
jgi:hypothetical protein